MANVLFIGAAAASGASGTIPTHQTGDIIFGFAYRDDGSTIAPSLPSGWVDINSGGANANAARLGYKIAASASETSGTWTNATHVAFLVYRNSIGVGAQTTGGGNSTTVQYPSISVQRSDGTSWVAFFAGHGSTNTTLETPPGTYLNRLSYVDAVGEVAAHDTNAGFDGSFTGPLNVSVGGTAAGYRVFTVEILARRDIVMPAAQGTYSVLGSIAQVLGPTGKSRNAAPLPHIGLLLDSNVALTLAANQGTYSITGQAAGLRASHIPLTANQGTYGVTGQAAALSISARGSSGYPAPLPHLGLLLGTTSRLLIAEQGTYSVTGQAAALRKGFSVRAVTGSYTVVGSDALRDFEFKAEQGTYSVSGQAAGMVRGRRVICDQGFYYFAGQAAGLNVARATLVAAGSVFSIAGQVAGVRVGRRMLAAQGSIAISGQAATLRRGRVIAAEGGSYATAGNAANLIKSGQQNLQLTAQFGSYAITGMPAATTATRLMPLQAGTYSISGQIATLILPRRVVAQTGLYLVDGKAARLTVGNILTAEGGTYWLLGREASFLRSPRALVAENGAMSITGYAATLRIGSSVDPAESRMIHVTAENRTLHVPVT